MHDDMIFRDEDDLTFVGRHGALPPRPSQGAVHDIAERARTIFRRYKDRADDARFAGNTELLLGHARRAMGQLDDEESMGLLTRTARDAPLAFDRDAATGVKSLIADVRRDISRDAGLPEADPIAAMAAGRKVSDEDRGRVLL